MNKLSGIDRHALMGCVGVLFMVFWLSFNFNHGERIQHNDGLGWDGAAYADWAQRDSIEILNSHTVSEYYIGRLLPSIIIHNATKLLDYNITSTPRVIHAFYLFNVSLLVIAAGLLVLIGRHYQWRMPIYFLGFSALFFNYPVLTNLSYNPTLTDISGYVLGLGIFYAYIKNRFALLVVLSFLCCFVWPTMLYGALPMIMLGRASVANRPPSLHSHLLALLVAISLIALAAYLYANGLRQSLGTTVFKNEILPLSIILFITYIYLALRPMIDVPAYLRASRYIKVAPVVVGILLYVSVKAIVFHFSDQTPGPLTITSYLGLFTQASLSNPLINVVAHAMHYGPFYMIAILLWPRIAAQAKAEGLGLSVFIALFAFLSIGSESRQFLNAWPALAMLTCQALNKLGDERKVDWWFTYAVAGMALILSRFWLSINVGPWTGNFQAFPDQMLYMYSGPWLSHQMYGVFLAVTLLCFISLLTLLRQPSSSPVRTSTQEV
ncbi:hypothetical protein ACIPIN_18420 [Pseudomonas sp. NPDC087697]|uniref:hypothetical protein n=1 Tax=Pseudomonas sp. NPDC087697 TaxID=3364447 RepID=UPI00382D73FD